MYERYETPDFLDYDSFAEIARYFIDWQKRQMESMTSKEESELCNILGCGCINVEYAYFNWSVGGSCDKDDMNIDIETFGIVVEWLNEHYFDYRNLIEKGLALPAPEGMYNKMEE